MTPQRFWSLCLALPVVLPTVTYPLVSLQTSESALLRSLSGLWGWVVLVPGAWILTYLIWAYVAQRWLHRNSADACRRGALRAPLMFAGIVFGLALVVSLALGRSIAAVVLGAGAFAVSTVLVGYGYVIACVVLYHLLRSSGVLSDARS